jgi:DNA-binding NarL/FixJ family response regulator
MTRWFLESRTRWEVCGEAANGFDAIEKAGKLNPDLILLDYSMPVLNGIEAGAVLQAILPEVPVVMFIGKESSAIESAAISAGIRAVVQKADTDRLAGDRSPGVAGFHILCKNRQFHPATLFTIRELVHPAFPF